MGTLYVVATPIGNLEDITIRAIEVLKSCDLVVCEDTRVTGKLLHHFEIKKEMQSVNEFNEQERVFEVLKKLEEGAQVALLSDAGTPLISDPGYLLVNQARSRGIVVVPIPGSAAFVAALSAAGVPTSSVLFLGFLSKKSLKRKKQLEFVKDGVLALQRGGVSPTIVLYESPFRLIELLEDICEVFGEIEITVAREVTKIHEEFVSGGVLEIIKKFKEKQPRGEICVLFNLGKA